MPKYRRKQEVIDAMRWMGKNHRGMYEFLEEIIDGPIKATGEHFYIDHSKVFGGLIVMTRLGDRPVEYGYWIIKGVDGEFSICKPDSFEATYEPVEQ